MRVALVLPGFQSDPSDWCIPAFTNLVRALAAQPGVTVDVFTLRYPHRRAVYRVNGATVHAFGGGAIVGGRRIWGANMGLLWWQFLAEIEREHRQAPFAVVHGFWATESGYVATRAGRRLKIPALAHLAGGELVDLPEISYGNWREPLAGRLVRASLAGATAITVPSTPLMDALKARLPANAAKAIPWRLGVDLAMFSPTPRQNSATLRVANVASLLPVKDQRTLLLGLAAARDRSPDTRIELALAGSGPLRGELERLAGELRLADRVRFVGALPHEQLADFYRGQDLFALSSRHEAQCMAALEAMACGLPTVATPVGALVESTAAGAGWEFAPGDAEGLAAGLLAAHDRNERLRRGVAAQAWAQNNADLRDIVAGLLAIYRRVAKSA